LITHIIERFFIHLFASTFLTLAVFFVLRALVRRFNRLGSWISYHRGHLMTNAALVVFALATLREPFDVSAGQVWYKAIADQISWFIGPIVSVWGLHRFRHF
jgi:hypothetical protein